MAKEKSQSQIKRRYSPNYGESHRAEQKCLCLTKVSNKSHCESFQTHAGADIGELISASRPDLHYLGLHDAKVVLNGIDIGLHHGAKGVPYAVSYHMQKYVEKIGAGQKPQIYVLGHYHSSFYMFYRGIHCFLPGCWQRANAFSIRLGLPECIGGWILDLVIEDDPRHTIRSINQKFVAYY